MIFYHYRCWNNGSFSNVHCLSIWVTCRIKRLIFNKLKYKLIRSETYPCSTYFRSGCEGTLVLGRQEKTVCWCTSSAECLDNTLIAHWCVINVFPGFIIKVKNMCFNGLYQSLFSHNNPPTNYKPFQYISYIQQLTSINLIIANTFAVILLWDIEAYMLQSPHNIGMALILVCRFARNLTNWKSVMSA